MGTLEKRYIGLAQAAGSAATTLRGALHWFRARRKGLIGRRPNGSARRARRASHPVRRWIGSPLPDSRLASRADAQARHAHPRKRNWLPAEPRANRIPTGTVETYDRRAGRWVSHDYQPTYHSAVAVARSGAVAVLSQEGAEVRRIFAPSGLRWTTDDAGSYLVARDGTDYHPTAADWHAPDFARRCRAALTKARKARRDAQQARARAAKEAEVYARHVADCRVTLHDARRAGLCHRGIIAHMARHHGMTRAQVEAIGATVPASTLIAAAPHDPRVTGAVACAVQRETLVCI